MLLFLKQSLMYQCSTCFFVYFLNVFTFVLIMGKNAKRFYLPSKHSTIKKLIKTEIVFK